MCSVHCGVNTRFIYSSHNFFSAVDEIVEEKKNVDKRSAEEGDGRNLLMAYLGNVGGYDREYRSVEDENTPGMTHEQMPWSGYYLTIIQ